MHYIFQVSFGTIKIFKFQIYYSNSHSLKEIITVTNITQIINSTLNPNLYFAMLKWVHQIRLK